MNITLYHNNTPKSHINRSLAEGVTVTGEPKSGDSLDILNPIITVAYSAIVLTKNYVYIPDFGRYYFITDMAIQGKTIQISMHVDVLYTYRTSVLNAQCIADRSSSIYDVMLTDSAVSAVAGYEIFSRSLPYTFRPDQGKYVLIVAGG